MTNTQIDTIEAVENYLHSIQIYFNDFGYAKISEVAEDYANELSEFSILKLNLFYGHRLKGICSGF